jgi:hypothetical protein
LILDKVSPGLAALPIGHSRDTLGKGHVNRELIVTVGQGREGGGLIMDVIQIVLVSLKESLAEPTVIRVQGRVHVERGVTRG